MKRAFGIAIAIVGAALASSIATAAPVTFDLTGVTGFWTRSADQNAEIPGPPTNGGDCGATGLGSTTPGSSTNCFRYPFAAGSSISIDITSDRVELLGGTLIVDSVQPIVFGTIAFTTHSETTIEPGLIGTLTGDYINWISPENAWMNLAAFSSTGTLRCDGPNCALIALPEAEELPLHPLWETLTNTSPFPGLFLGAWILNAAHDTIVESSTAVSAWSNVAEDGNRRQAGFTFGPALLGIDCPEPGLPALAAVAIGALALRSGKSGLTRGGDERREERVRE